jgi:hypothetical protein
MIWLQDDKRLKVWKLPTDFWVGNFRANKSVFSCLSTQQNTKEINAEEQRSYFDQVSIRATAEPFTSISHIVYERVFTLSCLKVHKASEKWYGDT